MRAVKKTHWLRNTIIVLLLCCVAGTALAAVRFNRHPGQTNASASLLLTFDGAAEGLSPNGNPFSVDEMRSDEVLEAALKAAGLEGVYSARQLRENLVITGNYPENLVEQVMSYESLMSFTGNRELTVNEFHPTLFDVALYNGFDSSISRAQLEGLLQSILDSFRARFAETSAVALDWQNDSVFNLEKYDYLQQLEVIQETLTQQARYAAEMYEKEPTMLLEGKGFNDIYVRLYSLVDSDIQRLNANITINALTRNTARLLTQYQYEIRDLNNQLAKQTEQLSRLDALIDSYEKNEIIYLSTTDSLTKIDGNSSETYDALVAARKEVSDGITEINSRIMTYQLKLSDLLKDSEQAAATGEAVEGAEGAGDAEGSESAGDAGTAPMEVDQIQELTDEEIAAAAAAAEEAAARQMTSLESDIASLLSKSEAITADFKALLDAYMAQEVNEQTVRVYNQRYYTPKLISGAFVKRAILTAGPLCALGLMVCLALLIASRRREGRKA